VANVNKVILTGGLGRDLNASYTSAYERYRQICLADRLIIVVGSSRSKKPAVLLPGRSKTIRLQGTESTAYAPDGGQRKGMRKFGKGFFGQAKVNGRNAP
jgi:hypothetical protein